MVPRKPLLSSSDVVPSTRRQRKTPYWRWLRSNSVQGISCSSQSIIDSSLPLLATPTHPVLKLALLPLPPQYNVSISSHRPQSMLPFDSYNRTLTPLPNESPASTPASLAYVILNQCFSKYRVDWSSPPQDPHPCSNSVWTNCSQIQWKWVAVEIITYFDTAEMSNRCMFLTVSLRPGQEQCEDWQPIDPTGIALLKCSRLHQCLNYPLSPDLLWSSHFHYVQAKFHGSWDLLCPLRGPFWPCPFPQVFSFIPQGSVQMSPGDVFLHHLIWRTFSTLAPNTHSRTHCLTLLLPLHFFFSTYF